MKRLLQYNEYTPTHHYSFLFTFSYGQCQFSPKSSITGVKQNGGYYTKRDRGNDGVRNLQFMSMMQIMFYIQIND